MVLKETITLHARGPRSFKPECIFPALKNCSTSGLKPASFVPPGGTVEAVPFPDLLLSLFIRLVLVE
jgi:hypothetical protein